MGSLAMDKKMDKEMDKEKSLRRQREGFPHQDRH
jgi:hypothetical protein